MLFIVVYMRWYEMSFTMLKLRATLHQVMVGPFYLIATSGRMGLLSLQQCFVGLSYVGAWQELFWRSNLRQFFVRIVC